MSKRNINGKTGKQLYLNQLFLKGMLHTSSEMSEGFAKTLTNFDINPTGDSAVPRKPLLSTGTDVLKSDHTYPVKFANAVNYQHYIEFTNVVSEEDYTAFDEGQYIPGYINANLEKGIKMYSRYKYDTTMTLLGEGSDTSQSSDNIARQNDLKTVKIRLVNNEDNLYDIRLTTDSTAQHLSTSAFKESIDINNYAFNTNSTNAGYVNGLDSFEVSDFHLYDGDSGYFIKYNGRSEFHFRLIGVNCPEKGNEYYEYGRIFLNSLIKRSFSYSTRIYIKNYGKDKDDRNLINLYLEFIGIDSQDRTHYIYMNINQVMVRMGLANVDYTFENIYTDDDDIKFIQKLITAKNESDINLNNESDTDFFFNYAINRVTYPEIKLNENSDVKYNNYIVESVFLSESTSTSNKVTNYIDKVQFIYNDGLDSIGFIGRIIDLDSGIILYKGPLNIKSSYSRTYSSIEGLYNYNCPNFTLYLPDNNLNGNLVNIVDGSTQGFNLLDKNMLHVEDTNVTSDPFAVVGLTVTEPSRDETTIVNQAIRGQKVKLNAVTNLGYYYNTTTSSTSHDDYDFNLEINKFNDRSIDPISISKSDFKDKSILNRLIKLETNVDIPTQYNGSIYADQYGVFKINNIHKLERSITITSNNGLSTSSLTFTQPYSELDGYPININDYLQGNKNQFTAGKFINETNSVFEIDYKLKLTNVEIGDLSKIQGTGYNTYDTVLTFELTLVHNFNDLSKRIIYNSTTELLDLSKSNVTRPMYFFTKWERNNVDGNWTTIQEYDEPTYYTTTDNNIVKKYTDKSDDTIWTVDCSGNVQLKFTIMPKIKIVEDDDTWLSGLYITNKFLEMYYTIPVFKIDITPEWINESDIRENVDLKNATRIGIFNRQTFLYGPYTKANFLQFSKFENEYYYPFPYHNVQIDEPITYVTTYQDSLVIFGKHNIWMLTGGTSILDCTLHKIYENLTTTLTDIGIVNTVGTYLMFSNHNMLYILVPNNYSDDPTNVKVYKLSENIINLLNNPEHYIRTRLYLDYDKPVTHITNTNTFSYIQNNEINIVCNYSFTYNNTSHCFVVMFIYNLDYKYWRMYDFNNKLVTSVISSYIFEPQYNNQFIATNNESYRYTLSILNNKDVDTCKDMLIFKNKTNLFSVNCYIDSGYLSVDTMNDKRFKDLIIEFDRILSDLYIRCNFYIDGSPIVVSDTDALLIDKFNNVTEISNCVDLVYNPETSEYLATSLENYDSNVYNSLQDRVNYYGSIYKINSDNPVFSSNRTHLRIPLFGKGRLPSFTLTMDSEKPFEFINYSIIYKEKNINRRR